MQSEYLVGHLPVKLKESAKGFFGGAKYSDCELLISNQRLLFLTSSSSDERWFQEQNDLDFDSFVMDEEYAKWRSVVAQYDFAKSLWNDYYSTPLEQLLGAHKKNFAVSINQLLSAIIELDDELDSLVLSCVDGTEIRCEIYLLLGDVAHRLLAGILDPSRLTIIRNGF